MGGGVHEKHAQQHDMACNATWLNIVNLKGGNRTNLSLLNVVKVDVVAAGVEDGEEKDGVGELSMHPEILVQREEADFGSQPSHDCTAYG